MGELGVNTDICVDNMVVPFLLPVILAVNVSTFTDLPVLAGTAVMLPCDVEGVDDPDAIVTWMRFDGLPLPDRSFITQDNSLIILDVQACVSMVVRGVR